jgi:hypothetical protein
MADKYTFQQFLSDILRLASFERYKIGLLRDTDYPQIDFGHKKLHGKHFLALFPHVLEDHANINKLIEATAPGRPCTHRPFRKIVEQIKKEHPDAFIQAIDTKR